MWNAYIAYQVAKLLHNFPVATLSGHHLLYNTYLQNVITLDKIATLICFECF